jgi:hypothetical protein
MHGNIVYDFVLSRRKVCHGASDAFFKFNLKLPSDPLTTSSSCTLLSQCQYAAPEVFCLGLPGPPSESSIVLGVHR